MKSIDCKLIMTSSIVTLIILLIMLTISVSGQSSKTICAGSIDSVTVSCSGGIAPYTVKWTKPNGDTLIGSTIVTDSAGIYSWICRDATNCSSTAGTHTVIIEASPLDSIVINAANVCTNVGQNISATGVPAGYTYTWNFGTNASPGTSTTASTNVLYTAGGSKTISLSISKPFAGVGVGCNETCVWVKTKLISIGNLTGSAACN